VCFLFGFPCVSTFFKTLDCWILGFGFVVVCYCALCFAALLLLSPFFLLLGEGGGLWVDRVLCPSLVVVSCLLLSSQNFLITHTLLFWFLGFGDSSLFWVLGVAVSYLHFALDRGCLEVFGLMGTH
jgi:hypothetical protein